jgi:hypothetical protein
MPRLDEVFRLSGIPTYTFVEPVRYDEIKVSLRTPGRCLVMEGPSGIGKSTTINKAVTSLGIQDSLMSLSARRGDDVDLINALPDLEDIGTVIVDDFHKLPDNTKQRLSDFMKVLADSETQKSKLILIGINKAGQQLVRFAEDLGLRIDVFRLEANPVEQIHELITRGEEALSVKFTQKDAIATRAQGSFQIAQLLCHKFCILAKVIETCAQPTTIDLSLDVVIEDVMVDLRRLFKEVAVTFARGFTLRREGRAPYLHMLKWLAESDEWSLDLSEALRRRPEHKASISQVLDKGYLEALLRDADKRAILEPHFHFEPSTSILSVEDPKLIFYLKNLIWRAFTRQVGFKTDYFVGKYDFALSFAGADRAHARRLSEMLSEREIATFFDEDEQYRIIARNVEDYLAPIYKSEARYVVAFLSPDYPTRIWTKFESDQFKERFGDDAVVPIRFATAKPNFFSDDQKFGGLSFDPAANTEAQLEEIARTLSKRLMEDRGEPASEADDEPKML